MNISAVLHPLLPCVCLENTELQPQSGHRETWAHSNALWLKEQGAGSQEILRISFLACAPKLLLIEICFCQPSQGDACRQHLQTDRTPSFCLEKSLTCLHDVNSPQLLGMGKDPAQAAPALLWLQVQLQLTGAFPLPEILLFSDTPSILVLESE